MTKLHLLQKSDCIDCIDCIDGIRNGSVRILNIMTGTGEVYGTNNESIVMAVTNILKNITRCVPRYDGIFICFSMNLSNQQ